MNTVADHLDDLLAGAGADLGRPDARLERAARLAAEGCTAAELSELISWGRETRRRAHTVGAWVCWATSPKTGWRKVLADVRKARAGSASAGETVNGTARGPDALSSAADPEWRQRMAFARVVVDRASHEQVAAEMRINTTELTELVSLERRRRDAEMAADESKHEAAARDAAEDVW